MARDFLTKMEAAAREESSGVSSKRNRGIHEAVSGAFGGELGGGNSE